MSTNVKITIYQDNEGKWRWNWWRSSDIVANSGQGYIAKGDAIKNLQYISGGTYVQKYRVNASKNQPGYAQGHLIGREGGEVFVETLGKQPGVQA